MEATGERHTKRTKWRESTGEVMTSVFYDGQGNFVYRLSSKRSEYYCGLLERLRKKVVKRRPRMKTTHGVTSQVRRHQNNAHSEKIGLE